MMTPSLKNAQRPRGQAAVEAGLGILVFVTVLVFGIFFAEVGYLSLKVTEAANHATFDATARRVHQYGPPALNSSARSSAVSGAAGAATGRYSDWDGRASKTGSAPRQVFTQAAAIAVTCNEINNAGGGFVNMTIGGGLTGIYDGDDQGGASCSAQGTVSVFGIGTFHEGDGFFRKAHIATGQASIKLCSFGRAWSGGGNGACVGEVPIALGDWSLSFTGNNETADCDLYGCTNTPYLGVVNRAFDNVKGPTGKGAALAAGVTGFSIDEGAFWFAFKGSEFNFQQNIGGATWSPNMWNITPGGPNGGPGGYEAVPEYKAAYDARQPCFLGFNCSFRYSTHN